MSILDWKAFIPPLIELGATMISQPLFLGGIEIAAIVLIVVLLFGASKIPEIARASGEATKEFERGRKESEKEIQELEEEIDEGLDDSDEEREKST